uniref:Uncharacterized protein n=1 Tax=Knipowitschia caucasica TaxID=637954 RepID=A0AAV2KEV6_KNICA
MSELQHLVMVGGVEPHGALIGRSITKLHLMILVGRLIPDARTGLQRSVLSADSNSSSSFPVSAAFFFPTAFGRSFGNSQV